MKKTLMLCLAVAFAFASCKKRDIYSETCQATPSFANDVKPLMMATCATSGGCHASGSKKGPGSLITFDEIYHKRNDIHEQVAKGKMPQNGSLSDAQKNTILCWIDAGAPNN